LQTHNILPASTGWDALRITDDIEAIVLGMHAKPLSRLQRARNWYQDVFLPEFIYEQSKEEEAGSDCGKSWQDNHYYP
jgi:UDP-N-acetylmuramate: L-alanyl-gamma-D-glutamyl-meso-diaminopimelate ligase